MGGFASENFPVELDEGLDGRGGGGGWVWNSLISKIFSPLFSFFKSFAYFFKKIHYSSKC